jgi:hypothetical protein
VVSSWARQQQEGQQDKRKQQKGQQEKRKVSIRPRYFNLRICFMQFKEYEGL